MTWRYGDKADCTATLSEDGWSVEGAPDEIADFLDDSYAVGSMGPASGDPVTAVAEAVAAFLPDGKVSFVREVPEVDGEVVY